MPFEDRYRDAGLTRNPFAARMPDDPLSAVFIDRGLRAPPPPRSKTLVQVIGESGLGKSTQLQHWRADVPGPYHYIVRRPYSHRWAKAPITDLVYGDEIDRMPAPLRAAWFRELRRREATVVIGTHADLTATARRAGFDAVITHHLEPLDRETMQVLLEQRLEEVSMPGGHASFSKEDLAAIHRESHGRPGDVEVAAHRALAKLVETLSAGEPRILTS